MVTTIDMGMNKILDDNRELAKALEAMKLTNDALLLKYSQLADKYCDLVDRYCALLDKQNPSPTPGILPNRPFREVDYTCSCEPMEAGCLCGGKL